MQSRGTFRHLQQYYEIDLLIKNDKYISIEDSSAKLFYAKKDFLFKGGNWRGIKQLPLSKRISHCRNPIVVSGHSDIPVNIIKAARLKGVGINKFFGTNTLEISDFTRALPTGLCDQTDNTPTHQILGDDLHLIRAHENSSFPLNFSPIVELNFTVANSSQRSKLVKQLQHGRNVVVRSSAPKLSEKTRIDFLISCREKSFVVCPPGNGHDTHRLWETLYMGGIPIIKQNRFLNPLVVHLPVLVVNSWIQVLDEDFLEKSWHRINNQIHDFDKLSSEYWLNQITGKSRDSSA